MLIIPIKEGEHIDRALKRFKKKFEKVGMMREIRSRQQFSKKSELKRQVMIKAVYVQQLLQEANK